MTLAFFAVPEPLADSFRKHSVLASPAPNFGGCPGLH